MKILFFWYWCSTVTANVSYKVTFQNLEILIFFLHKLLTITSLLYTILADKKFHKNALLLDSERKHISVCYSFIQCLKYWNLINNNDSWLVCIISTAVQIIEQFCHHISLYHYIIPFSRKRACTPKDGWSMASVKIW